MIRALSLTLLLLTTPLPAAAFDIEGLGDALGLDPETTRQIEKGARLAAALVPISDAEERKLGRAVAARVIGRYGIARMPRRTYYLNLLGTALAQRSDRPDIPYHFAVLDTPDVNAYACPGGYIFVTRGALAMVRDEAELAAVLAHEIAHVTERHIVKALQNSRIMKTGADAAAEAFETGGPLFERMTDFATDALFEGLEKSDEFDSDAKAVAYLDRIGYDYPAMGDVLSLLDARRRAGETRVLARTHPAPSERMRTLRLRIRDMPIDEPTGIRLKPRFVRHTREG